MKDYDKNKGLSYLQYWHVNNFKWVDNASQVNGAFIKNYNEESDEEYFLEVDV